LSPLTRAREIFLNYAGLVSKHRDRACRAGTSPNGVKVKNPQHPAVQRVKETFVIVPNRFANLS
jgi:hypothetical protein